MDPRALVIARWCGETRFAVVFEQTDDLSRVLAKCGLNADVNLLLEHSRANAEAILRNLLWKDMAYESECMPYRQAEALANGFLNELSMPGSRYYSNGDRTKRESWNPMTESTFDSGLVFSTGNSMYCCIWFQDED